jgi:hypothetical protein
MKGFSISKKQLILAVLLFLCGNSNKLFAQPDYKKNPEWIKMINDPNANYFEAIKAYETYWKYHEKPNGEEEEMQKSNSSTEKMTDKEKKDSEELQREKEEERQKDMNKKYSQKDMKMLEEKQEMIYQCKRFDDWIREVKPFVQEDGRILSEEERMDIYKRQIEEQHRQDKK